jgi:alpha-ketoglutarate-dependent taurine dioxygenase
VVSTSEITVRKVGGRIGALIEGVRLGPDLTTGELAAVRAAANRHKVVFFRGQDHLDDESQIGFGRRLGQVVGVPGMAPADIAELDSRQGVRANVWHTDVTFSRTPFAYSILRGVTVPAYGGDTAWANTAVAYAELPAPLRQLADQLWARHTNDYDYAAAFADQDPEQVAAMTRAFRANRLETEHPVVRVHPETGERALLLGAFARKLVGMADKASEHLLALLAEHVVRPEHTVRWTWEPGDVAIWDNRATQHYALNDYDDQSRLMRRVTIQGDVPEGVDGRTSRAIEA